MKRIYKIVLAFLLVFALTGCTNNTTEVPFDEFMDSLPAEMAGTNGFDLNYVFHDPSAYGIEKEVGDVLPATIQEYKDSIEECDTLLDTLHSYSYNSLTDTQKSDYDALEDYLERQLLMEDFAAFDNNYLGSFIGFQAQLPLILIEFELHDKQDLETYLNVLKTAPEAFKAYVDNEKERQEAGVGMSQVLVDGVIEQCQNFASGDVSFLVDGMNTKIDAASFLSDAEKEQAKADNESYTKNEFVNAYTTLQEELTNMDVKSEDGGIAQQENGPAYYEALFQKTCGFDWSIEELEDYLTDKQTEYIIELQKGVQKYPELLESFEGINYGTFGSVEENIDYLAGAYTKYFPDAGQMNYRVVGVPESMQENFSPAAYLTSRIDRAPEEPLLILINGEYDSENFSTIAHEGYPGHMYQDCYFQQKDASTFRYLLGCTGYSEGWATYIEGKTPWFTKNDNAEILEVIGYNSKLSYAMMAQWDIDVNYHGISREEFKQDILSMYGEGVLDDETINDQYTQLLENPTNYLMYFVNGLYFEDLYIRANEELGDAFDPITFHQVLLDDGEISMTLLTKRVDAYIEENK